MVYLYHLLDPALDPLDPDVPLQLSAGLLTGLVPAAARGQVTGVSPETGVLLDSNGGDSLPSFMKRQGIDRFVLYGRAPRWTYLYGRGGHLEFRDADRYAGMDNLGLRQQIAVDLDGRWGRDLAMANVTRAGELGVAIAGIMGGPKALWARGGPGAKMGSLRLKAIVLQGHPRRPSAVHDHGAVARGNRTLAQQMLQTGVVQHALRVRGTPFLYKPSRLLGAIGAKNHQITSWTDRLDAENLDPFRAGMTGCWRCPIRCRPLNDLADGAPAGRGDDGPGADPYVRGEGPDYVTLGKLGPMVGLEDPRQVVRLNNLVNDLGLDSASLGSSIAWALELHERGLLDQGLTRGLSLGWGDYDGIERLIRLTARRQGLGAAIADGGGAVRTGRYPTEALRYRMAVKDLMQSDPHDARIIKAFALGLAVATRGMDHLRNRPTLEINARINDDAAFKAALYGGPVAAAPQEYRGKELAVRRCEDTFAVGDALGLCRFATKLFNSPNLPGLSELSAAIHDTTGLVLGERQLGRVGRNITGLERILNHRLGVRREHDTLPARWFAEPISDGDYAGERIDRAEFEAMLDRFYALTGLDEEGQPTVAWRAELIRQALGFALRIELPPSLRRAPDEALLICEPVRTVAELVEALKRERPDVAAALTEGSVAFVVDGKLVVQHRAEVLLDADSTVELIPLLGGG